MTTTLTTIEAFITTRLQSIWDEMRTDERGEGLVGFLIIAVAVAAIALFVLGVFEGEAVDKINDLDLGDTPNPASSN